MLPFFIKGSTLDDTFVAPTNYKLQLNLKRERKCCFKTVGALLANKVHFQLLRPTLSDPNLKIKSKKISFFLIILFKVLNFMVF